MIYYVATIDRITPDRLDGFFVGWPHPPSAEMHLKILQGSDHVVLAIDEESDRVVGFITAISDGVLAAYIPLLEVLPEWRNKGIGSALVEHMLQRLEGLYMTDLLCDPDIQPFYEKLGMHPATGMMVRRYRRAGEGGSG